MLAIRGIQTLPRLSLRNRVMETLTYQLVTWYLDSGRGLVPCPAAWDRLGARDAAQRVAVLDEALARGQLTIHPGNARTLAAFLARFVGPVSRSSVLDALLLQFPAIALEAFSTLTPARRHSYLLRRAALRAIRHLRRVTLERKA